MFSLRTSAHAPIELEGNEEGSLLKVVSLTAGYGRAPAIWDVSFSLAEGECVAVLGANGAGKTTLAKAISGQIRPFSGSVTLAGGELVGLPPHRIAQRRLVRAPDTRGVFRRLTVQDNVELGAARAGKGKLRSDAEQRIYEMFPVLAERRRQIAGTLSGGEQQMLALSHVIAVPPLVLVADEVSNGLAPILTDRIYEIMREIQGLGVAIVLIEQFVHRALDTADRAIALQRGHVVWSGPCEDVTDELYFGMINAN